MTVGRDHNQNTVPTRRTLWKAAVKVPMYTVAFTPIVVGSASAYADTGHFAVGPMLAFLTAAVCIIAWLNLTNDVFDFDTGIDKNKAESVVNLCGGNAKARANVFLVANFFLVVGFSSLAALSCLPNFDPVVLIIMAVAVFGGYSYQGPPFRLGYYGLGEPICFITWFMTVVAAYYSQFRLAPEAAARLALMLNSEITPSALDHTSTPRIADAFKLLRYNLANPQQYTVLLAAVLVATPTALILLCSHFHQLEDDRKAGKSSPIVRLGTERASLLVGFVLVTMYVFQLVAWASGVLPLPAAVLIMLTSPRAYETAKFVRTFHDKPDRSRVAKYHAVRLHFRHGVALAVGLALSRLSADVLKGWH